MEGKVLITRARALAVTTAIAAATLALPVLAQSPVTIVVNGQTVSFDQPPVTQAGRVFVPLRGVFERLGATVVYANGTVNATGNGRTVQLHIGSTAATVNGQPVTVDVAPFLIGARTMVPLRFIAQSLGATVNYNDSSRTVAINGNGGGTPVVVTPNPGPFAVTGRHPTGLASKHPNIYANFSAPVRVGTVRVYLDGSDLTAQAHVGANGFQFVPAATLNPGAHNVRVTGMSRAGQAFTADWSFIVQ